MHQTEPQTRRNERERWRERERREETVSAREKFIAFYSVHFLQCHFYVLSLPQPLLKTTFFFFMHACGQCVLKRSRVRLEGTH